MSVIWVCLTGSVYLHGTFDCLDSEELSSSATLLPHATTTRLLGPLSSPSPLFSVLSTVEGIVAFQSLLVLQGVVGVAAFSSNSYFLL